ncbi:MAG: chorismate mutase, partial [Candidatus Hydrogenedentes bacterium]|nr:chorismate mutase [Candidatus Hydrogenedentota bacterium]
MLRGDDSRAGRADAVRGPVPRGVRRRIRRARDFAVRQGNSPRPTRVRGRRAAEGHRCPAGGRAPGRDEDGHAGLARQVRQGHHHVYFRVRREVACPNPVRERPVARHHGGAGPAPGARWRPEEVTLEELRARIDALDAKILECLNARAQCAIEIAEIKRSNNQQYYVPEREKSIYDAVREKNPGPLPDPAIKAIYREIISAVRALEKPVDV